MANVKIFGDSIVVTSNLLMKDILKLKQFKPEALKLVDKEKKEDIFALGTGSPSFNKFGASFISTNDAGKAQATFPIPSGMTAEEKMAYAKDWYGYALLNLNKLEAQAAEILNITVGEFAEMEESITVIE